MTFSFGLLAAAAGCSSSDTSTATSSGAGGVANPGCVPLPVDPAKPVFGYDPKDTMDGPAAWGTIPNASDMPAYPECGDAKVQQAPIALPSVQMPGTLGGLTLDATTLSWTKASVTHLENKGYTWQGTVAGTPANTIQYKDEAYTLAQFHFHTPSEHTLGGKSFPMEGHFVHVGGKGLVGVAIGILFEESPTDNPELAKIWDQFNVCPEPKAVALATPASLELSGLFPTDASHFEYDGGLTAPPCTQTVHFVIMSQPMKASAAQMKAFSDSLGPTNRPTQPVLKETVLTFKSEK